MSIGSDWSNKVKTISEKNNHLTEDIETDFQVYTEDTFEFFQILIFKYIKMKIFRNNQKVNFQQAFVTAKPKKNCE